MRQSCQMALKRTLRAGLQTKRIALTLRQTCRDTMDSCEMVNRLLPPLARQERFGVTNYDRTIDAGSAALQRLTNCGVPRRLWNF